jgi:hypothetical protein
MINRQQLVQRHNPAHNSFDITAPFSVGNGEFAFTVDVTGLQTFPQVYEETIPLGTMSQWGWHSFAPPEGKSPDQFEWTNFETYGRAVPYPYVGATRWFGVKSAYWPLDPLKEELGLYLSNNPHRVHLGVVGLDISTSDGRPVQPGDLTQIEQTLDLWTGSIHSRFFVEGVLVVVKTCCHPTLDMVAAVIESPLIADGRLKLRLAFPGATPEMSAQDWQHPDWHCTNFKTVSPQSWEFERVQDKDSYHVQLVSDLALQSTCVAPHTYHFEATEGAKHIAFCCCFIAEYSDTTLPSAEASLEAGAQHWQRFWEEGAAVELAGSHDPRAHELERRIVLSQYLTAIQCAGTTPPQETGLTFNSWNGKFHLEMHWWHAAHFAFWNRTHLLERSLGWYQKVLPVAQKTAQRQGYQGARWPKQIAPDGEESPSSIGPLLIWQQPHPILYAEYCYRENSTPETLQRYAELVQETAAFMASYAVYDEAVGQYVLGPPLIPAQENHDPFVTRNPAFELAYWAYGLSLAQQWRERQGLKRDGHWDDVLQKLAPLPQQNGVYLAHEHCPETFTKFNVDHPSTLGAWGMIPGPNVDATVMRNTLQKTLDEWEWPHVWGWDFPLAAMTAARLGLPGQAVDFLLMDAAKNTYSKSGHCHQFDGLPLYLPANGGLLVAVAMMAAGWEGGPEGHAPGFPGDGSWNVQEEGLKKYL